MFKELSNKTYEVGGSIRNEFLGRKPNDIDFVIETTEEEFNKIFPNAKKVGNSFPVYLIEDYEVALTRTERSSGTKYQDFIVDKIGVSIEEDLSRRDISINSIARNYITGELVDPYNGIDDINNKIIRTINPKFVLEDPLRVYRIARFAAEFDFNIDKKTIDIIQRDQKEIKRVLPERIYAELKKMYERSAQPSIFFRVLYNLGVLKYHFKPLYVATSVPAGPSKYHGNKSVFDHLLDSFDNAKYNGHSFSVAIASLVHDFGKIITQRSKLPHHYKHELRGIKLIEKFFESHKFDAHTVELAKVASRHHMQFHILTKIKKPVKLIRFYKSIKKLFKEVIEVAQNDHGVSIEEREILSNLEKTFKETEIVIPDEIHTKGKEAIINFVESKYAEKYKKIVNSNE